MENELNKKSLAKENEQFTILVASRLNYRKGHSFLFDALKELPCDCEYVCHIVGEGPEKKMLNKKCNDYNLGSKVSFLGKLPYNKMTSEYEIADVLILPSLRETTGTVVLEAMSHSLPVITLKRFGALNLLSEDSAFFIDGNSRNEYVDNLNKLISKCINAPDEVLKKGVNAKQCACAHTFNKKNEFYQSIYDILKDETG